jgi:hypothetical protein
MRSLSDTSLLSLASDTVSFHLFSSTEKGREMDVLLSSVADTKSGEKFCYLEFDGRVKVLEVSLLFFFSPSLSLTQAHKHVFFSPSLSSILLICFSALHDAR